MRLALPILILLITQQSAFSAVPPSDFHLPSNQVPFFKSPASLFPSGYSGLDQLQKRQMQQTLTPETVYLWNGKTIGLSEIRPVLPVHLSKSIFDKKTTERWKIIETQLDHLKVENLVRKTQKTFAMNEVISDPFDIGYALTLKDAYLRGGADQSAKILTTIPQGFRLEPVEFKNGFFKVQYKQYAGYVSLAEALTKFDMATLVYFDKKWHLVKKREFDFIVTKDDQKIQMGKVERLVTPDTRGIVASSSQKIPLWSRVDVVQSSRSDWIQSDIKDHGLVWWRKSQAPNSTGDDLTTDDLIRRNISSVSFHAKNPSKGILSSNGVYMTEDGLHWKKLPQFENFNGPVHYFNDLLIFVGQHRSVDGGRTFENYIQIDKLAQAIEDQYGFLPKRLQVHRIETKPPYRLKIEIDTGIRRIKMESPLFTQDWKASKS